MKVEQTKPGTPEEVKGTAEVGSETPAEAKTVISRILDIIQNLQDNANEMAYNLGVVAGDIYDRFGKPKTENVEKEVKKAQQERDARDELFKRE